MKNKHQIKEFARYTTLNVLGMIGLSCYILADTFFISIGLGSNGLTALNLAIPIYSFIHGCGLMLGIGGGTKYSIYKSGKDHKAYNSAFTNTIFGAAFFAVLFVLTGVFFSETLTQALGADAKVFEMTNTYLKVILLFAPAFIMNAVMVCFVRNDGNPKLSMLAMLGGSFSNIILDYIFIFPLQMGIFGAVFATGLAPIISMLILMLHWVRKSTGLKITKTKPDLGMLMNILSLGLPSLIAEVSSGIVIIVFNIIILNLKGNVGVAAYGVVANLSLVVAAIYTGMAQGIQPLVSKAYGRNDKEYIKRIFRYATVTMAAASCAIYAIIFFFADPIAKIFNSANDKQLQEIATLGLKLYFTAVLFLGYNIIISAFFTSTARALPAQITSLSRGLLVIVPMAFLLSSLAGLTGVWLAFPATELLVAILGAVLYSRVIYR